MKLLASMVRGVISLLTIVTWGFNATAQTEIPPLERVISVESLGSSSQEVLSLIEVEAGCHFAYRTELVPASDRLLRSYSNKTTREILDDLFQSTLTYKEKGNYIILKKAKELKPKEVRLEGYVVNTETGEKVAFASIYDTVSLVSTISDAYGHYALQLTPNASLNLFVKKEGYRDTLHVWDGKTTWQIDIAPQKVPVSEDTSALDRLKNLRLSEEQKANLNNFKQKLKQTGQVSVVPGVGTNSKLGPVTTVDYSLNLIGGFNQGVRKAELGGIFNLDWDSVQYFQAAGIFNAVGGPQKGGQLAGIANFNNASFTGLQAAGFYSLTRGNLRGMQASGFSNSIWGKLRGAQGAGFANYAGSGNKALQAAGFANVGLSHFHGVQAAGFANYTGNNSSGAQLAGFLNIAWKDYRGLQVAGFANVARTITGYQLGIINYSDSIDGVPFGLLSFSRKGLHQLEFAATETMYGNISFRTGTNQFYNILSLGARFDRNAHWSYGYGIGTSVRTSSKSRLFMDLEASSIKGELQTNPSAFLGKFSVNYHYQFTPNVALAIGPSYNVYVVQSPTSDAGAAALELTPYSFYNQVQNDTRIQMWVGGKLALRFF